MIMSLENELSEFSRGDHHGGHLTELEVDDGAEFLSELSEFKVGHVCEEVQVTDDGEL